MINIRRHSTTKALPALNNSTKNLNNNNPQSIQKNINNAKNVKQIQQKLSLHDNQIIRTQKTILTLTNQFKIIKDQLIKQQDLNRQNQKMYQLLLTQNNKLNKKNKQLRVVNGSLQLALKQRQKQLQIQKDNWRRQNLHNQNQKQIQLKAIIDRKIIQNQALNKLVDDLKKQNLFLKKQNSKQLEQKQAQQIYNKLNQIKNLTNQIQKKDKTIKILQKQQQKLKDDERKYINIVKQHSKCQHNFGQVKKTNQFLLIKIKDLQNQNKDLKQKNFHFQEKNKKIQQQHSKGIVKLKTQLVQTAHKLEKQRKINQSNTIQIDKLKNYIEVLKNVQIKLQKFTKTKQNLKKSSFKLKQSIICDYCRKIFHQPVTNIPCGHSFCLDCKKGYQKQCKKCISSGSLVKRQAVYRNQLMDEVLQAYSVLNQIIRIFQ